jgi:hypothetical protein
MFGQEYLLIDDIKLHKYARISTFFTVESDDFKHDVRLYVNGDFEDVEEKLKYAEQIAVRLNKRRII